MRRLALSLLTAWPLAAAASPAATAPKAAPAAADATLWALCLAGEGCRVCRTALTHDQADRSLGALGLITRDPGHIVTTMRKADGTWSWYYDTRRTPADLDRQFGGPGRELQDACPSLPGAIQPRDGHWRIANDAPKATGCPAGVEGAVASTQLMRSGPVVFDKPFRASSALPDASVAWVQVAPDRHVGSFVPAGQTTMRARYQLDVVSPDAMEGALAIDIAIPGQPRCKVVTAFRYERTGD